MTEIDTLSLPEMIAKRDALEKQIAEAQKAARNESIATIRRIMADAGLTLADLSGTHQAKSPDQPAEGKRAKVAAKYRNPTTGETWTGRGLKPKWLSQALTDGKSLEEFFIKSEASEPEEAVA